MKSSRLDAAAVGVSGLCLAHCFALPVLAAVLPALGALSGNELVHTALVLAALPMMAFALAQSQGGRDRVIFAGVAVLGAGLLVVGAFVHELHHYEQVLTVVGAVLLGGAHAFRWQRHASSESRSFPPEDHL